jgi:hypothetical protein
MIPKMLSTTTATAIKISLTAEEADCFCAFFKDASPTHQRGSFLIV